MAWPRFALRYFSLCLRVSRKSSDEIAASQHGATVCHDRSIRQGRGRPLNHRLDKLTQAIHSLLRQASQFDAYLRKVACHENWLVLPVCFCLSSWHASVQIVRSGSRLRAMITKRCIKT